MKLLDAKKNTKYEIVGFGNINQKNLENLTSHTVIESEVIEVIKDYHTSRNIVLFVIDNVTYALNKKYAKEIEIRELTCLNISY